jgi:prepilin peptidase CpaA
MTQIVFLIAALVATFALVSDVRRRRIPNWLTLSALGLGLAVNLLLRGLDGGATALLGALLGFGLLFPFYSLRLIGQHAVGAGDVKLLAALGAILGPQALISVAIYGAVVGGLQSVWVLGRQGRLGITLHQALVMHVLPAPSGAKAPYAVAIAGGVFLAMVLPAAIQM